MVRAATVSTGRDDTSVPTGEQIMGGGGRMGGMMLLVLVLRSSVVYCWEWDYQWRRSSIIVLSRSS